VYPVPDGDTGTNMARTLDAVVAELDGRRPGLEPTCNAISHGSLMGARGNSGVILSQILRGLAGTLKDATEGDRVEGGRGADGRVGGRVPGGAQADRGHHPHRRARRAEGATRGRTTAARWWVLRAARARASDARPHARHAARAEGRRRGRRRWRRVPAAARRALHVVDGEPLPEPDEGDGPSPSSSRRCPPPRRRRRGRRQRAALRGHVLPRPRRRPIQAFKQDWGEIGDSIVVVGGDGIWNCHVHTNDIGAAIEVAIDLGGRPRQIRVTDLFEEVAEEHAHREAALTAGTRRSPALAGLPPVTCAVVAVASGDGLVELFGNLGVQGVVTGRADAEPLHRRAARRGRGGERRAGGGAAQQQEHHPGGRAAGGLTTKTVVVVPTTSMPEALAALVLYDPEADAAPTPSRWPNRRRSDGHRRDHPGGARHQHRCRRRRRGRLDRHRARRRHRRGQPTRRRGHDALLEHLVGPTARSSPSSKGRRHRGHTDAIVTWLDDQLPGCTVEVHRGGQPLYPYLFGVE
jgi:hypothetical protein